MALKEIEVTLTLDNIGQVEGPHPRWSGADGSNMTIIGQVREICVVRDGKEEFGIIIREDGSLILTKYGGGLYEMYLSQNLHIRPTQPWKENHSD